MTISECRLRTYPKDFSQARVFYEDVLGFDIAHEWDRDDSKGVMFAVGTTTLEFLWPLPDGYTHSKSGYGLSLQVDDVWSVFESLKDSVDITHAIRENPWGDTSFGMKDPEGLQISLFTKTKDYQA